MIKIFLICLLALLLQKGGHAQVIITAAPATATVAENVAADTALSTFTATGGTTTYMYSISGENTKFKIVTDELQTNTGLNFEAMVENTVVILAVDSAMPALTGTLTFTLTLTDVNEAPTFAEPRYARYIQNNAPAGTTVGTFTATDEDAGTDGTIASYTINAAGNTDTTFAISTAGVITVATSKTASDFPYVLEVVAVDGATTALSGTTTVVVVVDNSSGASKIAGFVAVMVSLVFQAAKYI